MKYILILINLIAINFLSGCAVITELDMRMNSREISDNEYWKSPCLVDGAVMKKKPQTTK
jgi:hypothetical protein